MGGVDLVVIFLSVASALAMASLGVICSGGQ